MKHKLIFILSMASILSLFSNCENNASDMPFALKKRDFYGTQFRIDGYYYQKYGTPEKLTIYFFYRNGILLHAGDGYTIDIEAKFENGELYEKLKENKYCWGLFNIDSNIIQFERYYNSDDISKDAYIRSGEILNDSTFRITKSMRSDGKEVSDENEMYYFKKFSPKIDSTNVFVK